MCVQVHDIGRKKIRENLQLYSNLWVYVEYFWKTYDWLMLIWKIISRVPPTPLPLHLLGTYISVLKNLFKLSPPAEETLSIIDTFSDQKQTFFIQVLCNTLQSSFCPKNSPPPGSSCLGMFCVLASSYWLDISDLFVIGGGKRGGTGCWEEDWWPPTSLQRSAHVSVCLVQV